MADDGAETGIHRDGEIEISSPLSREELAHLLGTTIETVSRRLNAPPGRGAAGPAGCIGPSLSGILRA